MKRLVLLLALATACATVPDAPPAPDAPKPAWSVEGPAWRAMPEALARDPKALQPGLAAVTPRAPVVLQLGNGATLYLLEDPSVPLLDVSVIWPVGSIHEPADRLGLASLAAEVMRTGGAGALDADALDARLDALGLRLEVGAGQELTSASVSALAGDADVAFGHLADVLLRPRLQADRLEVARLARFGAIERRPDDPAGLAARAFRKALYGKDSPWAREATKESISKLSPELVRGWLAKTVAPEGARVVVTGGLPAARLEALARAHFGPAAWPARRAEVSAPAKVSETPGRRVVFVPKKSAQAKIRLGHLALRRGDPDETALLVSDSVLGSAPFVSRLARKIRSDRGLAYAISASSAPGADRGTFAVNADTRPEKVVELVSIALEELQKMERAPAIGADELALGKDRFVNSFAFRFDTARKAALERAISDLQSYPEGWIAGLSARVAAVDVAAAEAVAKRSYRSADLVIVVVGDPSLAPTLAALGPVTTITDVEGWK